MLDRDQPRRKDGTDSTAERIATVRGFNRFYTRQIGVLRKTFLDSPYSLGEARVLYEIASRDAPTASEIGRALDLDAGYLSRVLRNFEKRGLIRRTASTSDARQSHLTLTPRGRKDFAPLERRSQHDIGAMLGRLRPDDQLRLIAAMNSIHSLLGGTGETAAPDALDSRYILRTPRPGDFGWIVKRHAELYAQEYGWIEPFEGVCAQIVADFANKNDPQRERCFFSPPIPTQWRAYACCWSIRRRAGSALARGWSRNASASPAMPATKRSRYGRTASSPPRGTFIRKPALCLRAARSA
jgi:DNA-binding MarR family transcriptional regulator